MIFKNFAIQVFCLSERQHLVQSQYYRLSKFFINDFEINLMY